MNNKIKVKNLLPKQALMTGWPVFSILFLQELFLNARDGVGKYFQG